jgi:hypothetical protein
MPDGPLPGVGGPLALILGQRSRAVVGSLWRLGSIWPGRGRQDRPEAARVCARGRNPFREARRYTAQIRLHAAWSTMTAAGFAPVQYRRARRQAWGSASHSAKFRRVEISEDPSCRRQFVAFEVIDIAKFPPMGTPEHQEHRLLACLSLRLLTPGPLRMLRMIRRRKFGIDHPRAYAMVHLSELRHLTASFAARLG